MRRPVLVCTPCNGSVCINYHKSTLRLPPIVDFEYGDGGSLITCLRNKCVEKFLDGNWENLFFIDSDIGFSREEFDRLMKADFPIVAAPYASRRDGRQLPEASVIGEPDEDGFAVTREAPTGFMRIRRFALELMVVNGIERWEFFDTMQQGTHYLSEDYAFCRRWQAIGGQIHLDTRAKLTHQGTKLYAL